MVRNYERRLYGRKGFNGRRRMKRVRPTRQRGKRRLRNVANADMILYKSPHNYILPPKYYTKLHSRYSGAYAVAAFTAGAAASLIINANDVFTPFGSLPATNITWVNGVSPLALAATGHAVLGKVDLYENVIVYATELRVSINPSNTTANDSTIFSIVPTNTSSGSAPSTLEASMKQPFMKFRAVHGQGGQAVPLSCYMDWAKFLGVTRKEFIDDAGVTWGQLYNAAPTNKLYMVINLSTVDAINPTNPIPFTIELIQYVKYGKMSAAQVNP